VDESKRTSYTLFVLNATSGAARQALEDLMSTAEFSDPFIDRFLAEGKAEGLAEGNAEGLAEGRAIGEARMILRILAARGLQVSAVIRERVLSCSDIVQLEAWGDRAATADSVEDVFGS
jgi:predicted transposase YdaD